MVKKSSTDMRLTASGIFTLVNGVVLARKKISFRMPAIRAK